MGSAGRCPALAQLASQRSSGLCPPATGIDYLNLVAETHQQQIAADHTIGYHALYGNPADRQLPGQLSIHDIPTSDPAGQDTDGGQDRP